MEFCIYDFPQMNRYVYFFTWKIQLIIVINGHNWKKIVLIITIFLYKIAFVIEKVKQATKQGKGQTRPV